MKEIFKNIFMITPEEFYRLNNTGQLKVIEHLSLMGDFDQFTKIEVMSHRVDKYYIFANLRGKSCRIGFPITDFEMMCLPEYGDKGYLSSEESMKYVDCWRKKFSDSLKYKEFDILDVFIKIRHNELDEIYNSIRELDTLLEGQ